MMSTPASISPCGRFISHEFDARRSDRTSVKIVENLLARFGIGLDSVDFTCAQDRGSSSRTRGRAPSLGHGTRTSWHRDKHRHRVSRKAAREAAAGRLLVPATDVSADRVVGLVAGVGERHSGVFAIALPATLTVQDRIG